ncbi:hypothetical protein Vafri_11534 [Volvox africanus]|nr:hypothetical protein Vafri_11534 [Volvox africanus]
MQQKMHMSWFDSRMHRSKCPYRAGRPSAPYNAHLTFNKFKVLKRLTWARDFINRRHVLMGALPHDADDSGPSPIDLMRLLAVEHGLRVAASSSSRREAQGSSWEGEVTGARSREANMDGEEEDEDDDDDDDDEESWEDAVADLGNPWDMRPAKVDLMDEDDRGDGRPGAAVAPGAGPATATATATAVPNSSVTPSPSSPASSPYLDLLAFPRIGRQELLDLVGLRSGAATGAAPAAGGSSGGSGVAGSSHRVLSGSCSGDGGDWKVGFATAVAEVKAEMGGRARVVVLDVREEKLETEGNEEAQEAAATADYRGRSTAGAEEKLSGSTSLDVSTELAAVVPYVRIPLNSLRRPQAEALAGTWDYVAVAATPGDHLAQQAIVRLTRVYGLRRVLLYDDDAE